MSSAANHRARSCRSFARHSSAMKGVKRMRITRSMHARGGPGAQLLDPETQQPTEMLVRDADRPGGYRCGACGLTAAFETKYTGPLAGRWKD